MTYREQVKKDWANMLKRGIMPVIEQYEENGEDNHTVDFGIDDYGVYMSWHFPECEKRDNIKPCFDGEVQKRHGAYYISFAEVDRMGYKLDNVLQLLYENFKDGVLYI